MLIISASAFGYEYADNWSTPGQRIEWRKWLREQSTSEIATLYHPLGHLHGFSGRIPLASTSATDVKTFLLGPLRHQLGLGSDDAIELRAVESHRLAELTSGSYVTVPRLWFRFGVQHKGYLELGRDIIAIIDGESKALVGLFNGHIPSLAHYVVGTPKNLDEIKTHIETLEGESIEFEHTEIGWYTPSWLDSQKPGSKVLSWLAKVRAASGERDYIVNAPTGDIIYRGGDKYWFAHQLHQGYTEPGFVFFDTRSQSGCASPGGNCTDPAFSDSLISRDAMPRIVQEVETLTTAGYRGQTGQWSVPPSWQNYGERMNPYQNNHLKPETDTFAVVVAATQSTSSFCQPLPAPCSNRTKHVYGIGDTDPSLYGHEYAHGLFAMVKALRSQTGPDGQVAEGVMDIAGVSIENAYLARQYPCAPATSCSGPRPDFILNAPSIQLSFDMRAPALRCDVPRAWLHSSFFAAREELALRDILFSCPPNGLCGLPTRPGSFVVEQDLAIEAMFGTFLDVFDATPRSTPTPGDVAAASLSLSSSSLPARLLFEELDRANGGMQCP